MPQVKFVDRTFNCNKKHAMAIWRFIQSHDNGVTNFHFEISADILNEEELRLLRSLRPGLVQLEIGVQSTNPQTIREIRRAMDWEKLKKIVASIQEGQNIHIHLDLIAGLPCEDLESFRRSFNDVYACRPEQLQLGFLKVLKGSYMHEKASEYGIHYTDKPPYEVLFTRWLPYGDVLSLKNHVNNIIIEYVEGIEVVKAFNQSTSSYEKFVGAVKSFKDFTLNWFKSTWKTMNLMMAIMPTTLLGVLPVGLLLVRGGSITPAELAMGIILSLSIVGPLMKATTFINEAKSMEYAVEAANKLLNLPNLPDSGEFVPINHTDIVLQDVSFSYDGTTQNEVLHGISLNMPQGSFTALVGPSGGGKSTVARLIARFWDVTGGSISIGGKNIKELSIHQLSELVSFVTQDNFLFNCSLKENIRLGNPNATDEEVYAAAKAACCDDFIARLEKGYDTPAGDAGKRLSGGEKQRIAIARAILKNAPIVILDEATAFTDPQNEDKIQKSIMALSKGKTLLVIAHRLSTIQNADQIVVLKKGQIVDCGKQEELLERCPLYADMWQAHIGAKNWSVGEKKEVAVNV